MSDCFSAGPGQLINISGAGWLDAERKRHLLRLRLARAVTQTLRPVFAECCDDITPGDRGGIICKGTRLHAPLQPG